MKRNGLIGMLLLMALTPVFAQQPPIVNPIQPGSPGKNPGDIIAPFNDAQIAAWCDFNKQIVVTRTNVLCVYIGNAVCEFKF